MCDAIIVWEIAFAFTIKMVSDIKKHQRNQSYNNRMFKILVLFACILSGMFNHFTDSTVVTMLIVRHSMKAQWTP